MQICFIRVLNVMSDMDIMAVLHTQNSLNFPEHIFLLLLSHPMKQNSSWALLPCELIYMVCALSHPHNPHGKISFTVCFCTCILI